MWGMLWEARYRTVGAKGPRQKSPDRCLQGGFWNNPGFSLCSWMDNVFYRDEEDWGWRSTLGRKLKRPILGMLSSRCWVDSGKRIPGGALCLWVPDPALDASFWLNQKYLKFDISKLKSLLPPQISKSCWVHHLMKRHHHCIRIKP